MTSPKIIREREWEAEAALNRHSLLSAAYSALQQNFTELAFAVSEVGVRSSFSFFTAVRNGGERREILIVLSCDPREWKEKSAEVSKHLLDETKKGEKPVSTAIALPVSASEAETARGLLQEGSLDYLLVHDESGGVLSIEASGKTPSAILDKVPESRLHVVDNFPHPYHPSLDPFIKFAFISLNGARSGKDSFADVLNESVQGAYSFSVGISAEQIRAELLELIKDMDRAGIITARGNEIYFPKNEERLRKSFIRKYWDYVEKIGKRTLFDFEAHF